MIAKLICWGDSRAEAVMRMRRALSEFRILGVKTNIPFHVKLVDSARFQAGMFDTRFVEDRFALEEPEPPYPDIAAIAATLVAHQHGQQTASHIERNESRTMLRWKWSVW
jgi:acetyl-CoA carboxylase, biotin carboxylase subunit